MRYAERKEINLKACRLIRSLDISMPVTDFDVLRCFDVLKYEYVGYAEYYLLYSKVKFTSLLGKYEALPTVTN